MIKSIWLIYCFKVLIIKVPYMSFVYLDTFMLENDKKLCLFSDKLCLQGNNTSILLIELFIASTSIIHRWFKWCNGSLMIKFSKKTVVLTCIKIRMKVLYSFNC